MSESSVETGRTAGNSNVFTRKVGVLPMWGWMGIALLLAIVVYAYNKHRAAATAGAATGGVNSPGGVDASLVPQFVNQVYTQNAPPPAPDVTNVTVNPPPVVLPKPPGPPHEPPPRKENEPATVSSEPGSFTTGLAGGLNEWTSTGKYSLNTIAKSHGMTAQQLIAVSEKNENNVGLQAYVAKKNYNAKVPAGVHLFFPNANWKK